MRELAKLRALTAGERRVLVGAAALLPVVASGLAVFGYARMHDVMARLPHKRRGRYSDGPEALSRAQTVSRIVAVAAAHGPVRTSCLRRALVTWWLLRRDGLTTHIRVGVTRGTEGGVDAHAWVEYLGRPLTEPDDVAERFIPFERDFAAFSGRSS